MARPLHQKPTCGEVAGVGGGAVKARQCLALVSMAFIPMRAMETRAKQLTENEKLLSEKGQNMDDHEQKSTTDRLVVIDLKRTNFYCSRETMEVRT